jgi:SAM-dependent methyltransferase
VVRSLPRVIPAAPDKPKFAGPDHPMRKVTRQVAFEPTGWTPERAAKVTGLFDSRMEPLVDALERGRVAGGLCVEVGSGTGFGTRYLVGRFEVILALDIAMEMLARAPAELGHRVRADGARLPLRDASADALVLVNALLFPGEVNRVLAPEGAVVWVNSLGDQTPIHLAAHDVANALPGSWQGVESEAGWGTWCVLRRAGA